MKKQERDKGDMWRGEDVKEVIQRGTPSLELRSASLILPRNFTPIPNPLDLEHFHRPTRRAGR